MGSALGAADRLEKRMDSKFALLALKGMLTEAPPEDLKRINETADAIRELVRQAGPAGMIALTMVLLEQEGFA